MKYLKVSPRGFANEYTIYAVPEDKVDEANAAYAGLEDDVERGGYTNWVAQPQPGQALPWRACPWSAEQLEG